MFNFFKALSLMSKIKSEIDNAMQDGVITIDEAFRALRRCLPDLLKIAGYTRKSVGGLIVFKK